MRSDFPEAIHVAGEGGNRMGGVLLNPVLKSCQRGEGEFREPELHPRDGLGDLRTGVIEAR